MARKHVDAYMPDSEFVTAIAQATIANGESLSAAIDVSGKTLLRINMPATWTTANLTFQFSADNSTYRNLYKDDGTEYTVTAAASRAIVLDASAFLGVSYIKVRSGTSGAAVNQGGARTIDLVTRKI